MSLMKVAIISGLLALVLMVGLMSARNEKNYFGEIAGKAASAVASAQKAVGPAPAALRKCVINGKTVFSDTECKNSGEAVKVQETKGIESPKVPPKESSAPTSDPMLDKAIQKQLN